MVPNLARIRDRFDGILLDLDGTLLDGRSQVTQRTVRAIRALEASGMLVVLCTGRSVAGTRPVHRALGLEGPVVAYNGGWIGHPDSAAPWHVIPIPLDTLAALLAAEREAHFAFRHAAERKHSLLSGHPEHLRVAAWYENVVLTHMPEDLPVEDLMRVSMFFEGEERATGAFDTMPDVPRGRLQREVFPLSLFPPYRGSRLALLEIQGASRGKAEAFAWLEAEHGIPADRVIAVGDHRNDRTMLAGAGLAVVPDNAAPEVRPLADLVIGHHADEAIAFWIEQGAPVPAAVARSAG